MHKETSASANYTAEIEVDRAYIDEGSLCHTETSFKLKPPRTTQNSKTEKNLKDNDRGGSSHSGKDLDRGQGNSRKHSLLALFHGHCKL
jgi:hypothetical protein